MGRPIQKKWFGDGAGKIKVEGIKWADGTTSTGGFIVRQKGSASFIVSNGTTKIERVFMVNADSVSALMPGQCYITAQPFGGSALPCFKINQFRVDIFNVANTVPRAVGKPVPDRTTSYSWSATPANRAGQADLHLG